MRITNPLSLSLLLPALAASFLIPPELSETEIEAFSGIIPDLEAIHSPAKALVYLDSGLQDKDLLFEFSIPESDPSKLLINDVSIIPLTSDVVLKATAVPKTVDSILGFDTESAEKVSLGYDLMLHGTRAGKTSTAKEISVTLRINSIDTTPVVMQSVVVTVEQDFLSGALKIMQVKILEKGDSGCQGVVCVLNAVMEKMRARLRHGGKKGCGKKINGLLGGMEEPPHHGGHHHKHHGHHDSPPSHHGHHRAGYFLKRIFRQVLVPIFIGVVAGMSASLLGLLLARVVVMMYSKFIAATTCTGCTGGDDRSGRQSFEEKEGLLVAGGEQQEDRKVAFADEEEGLLAAPPAYENEGLQVVVEKE